VGAIQGWFQGCALASSEQAEGLLFADAGTMAPGLNIASLPNATASTLGIALCPVVSAPGVLRPVQCEPVAHEPFSEIGAADRTGRNGTPVLIQVEWNAVDRTPIDVAVEIIRRLRAATIQRATVAAAKLIAFRSINAPQPNTRPVNFQRVAIDNCGLTNEIIGHGTVRQQHKQQEQSEAFDHEFGTSS
jgi:hypothetical protein